MTETTLHRFEAPDEEYLTFTHNSGLRVFYSQKDFRNTYVVLGVNFGSVDEQLPLEGGPLPTGCAHFLEHKMFENPDGEDTFLKFSRVGASANAYTAHERTCYLFSTSEQVEEALAILLESVFTPHFTPENVRKEKGIIVEEINMYKDDPGDALYHALLKGLYEHCPVRENICGGISSVRQMTSDTLYRAYNAYYRPDNMVLSICGKCDLARLEALLDATLPQRPTMPLVKKEYPLEKKDCHRRFVRIFRDVATPMTAIGIKVPPFCGSAEERIGRFAAMCLLAQALFSPGSPFVGRLKEENLIPDEPSYELSDRSCFAHILFFADCYDPSALFALFDRQIKEIVKEGIDEDTFLRCKRVLYAEHLEEFNSTEDTAALYLGDALEGCDGIDYSAILHSITREEVNDLARSLLKKEKICKCRLLPYEYRKEHNNDCNS
ncbi:MAG: insulinase family protein [Clostridia bacterium]|nr:insulinase family protein [Clostridia bacterium]